MVINLHYFKGNPFNSKNSAMLTEFCFTVLIEFHYIKGITLFLLH